MQYHIAVSTVLVFGEPDTCVKLAHLAPVSPSFIDGEVTLPSHSIETTTMLPEPTLEANALEHEVPEAQALEVF
ncbi:MAG: hypothetical protein KGI71_04525 [Patescibacteria group bacterium]|nr:hypothetical protein [Patescibacteria group bacterium]